MQKFDNYTIKNKIIILKDKSIYRAIDDRTNKIVILKILKPENNTIQYISRLKNELEISKKIGIGNIIKPISIENINNNIVLIAQNVKGEVLSSFIKSKRLTLSFIFNISIKLLDIIENIHKKNIIIKSLCSDNLIYDKDTDRITLISLETASEYLFENQPHIKKDIPEENFKYLSPEQTGNIAQVVDYRTDFYSLGVILYELLTGITPIFSDDNMELINNQIEKKLILPNELDSSIPQTLSQIVTKLLKKYPDNRYQSAYGIKKDLALCFTQFNTTGVISTFKIAKHDVSDRFQVSEKLIGRDDEISKIISKYENSCTGKTQIVLVSGNSGVGKTKLITESQNIITKDKGFFISGKFEKLNRSNPYYAIVNAFNNLIDIIVTKRENKIHYWKQSILQALPINAQVIVDVIPKLELIVGKQPVIEKLGAKETENRFNMSFAKFINVFTQKGYPLVIFLDDLQWCDTSSLNLLEFLINNAETKYLFIIGAYRQKEVDEIHPLTISLSKLKDKNIFITNIQLYPLLLNHTQQIIKNTFKSYSNNIEELTKIVHSKTNGNPFFINQFLKNLHEENLIYFDYGSHSWKWDINKIKLKNYTDNVVDLLIIKVKRLHVNIQKLLEIAACLGNEFNTKTLSLVLKSSAVDIRNNLLVPIRDGLIAVVSENYEIDENNNEYLNIRYKFLHDSIHQTVYSLIDENKKKQLHLDIGQFLEKNLTQPEFENNIFKIVNHFNIGKELIEYQSDRTNLVELNLTACKKAKASAAYAQALNYVLIGINLIGDKSWAEEYNLSIDLYTEATECLYLCGDFDKMDEFVNKINDNAKTLLDKIKIYEIQIQSLKAQNNMPDALKVGLAVLKLLGHSITNNPKKTDVLFAYIKLKLIYANKKIENLDKLHNMADKNKLATMRILSSILPCAFITKPDLLPLLTFKQVELSIKYGNSVFSSYAYSVFALIQIGAMGEINNGYKFGQLALKVLNKFNLKKFFAETYFVYNLTIRHWKNYIKDSLAPLLDAHIIAMEFGDLEYAGNTISEYYHYSFFAGIELNNMLKNIDKYCNLLLKINQFSTYHYLITDRQVILNLLEPIENKNILNCNAYNENETLEFYTKGNDFLGIFKFYLQKAILSYLFDLYDDAIVNIEKCTKYIDSALGMYDMPVFYFYDSLIRIAIYDKLNKKDKKIFIRKINKNQKKIKKWSIYAPMNYKNKFYLIEAEKAKINNNNSSALNNYLKAIEAAKNNDFINEEAIANELFAKFYIKSGDQSKAKFYIFQAYTLYARWGAIALVEKIKDKYNNILTEKKI